MKWFKRLFALLFVVILVFLLVVFRIPLKDQPLNTEQWNRLIPSQSLPENVHCYNSNNNIDLVKYKNRFYVAFRTSPTHFASTKTALYVISTTDFSSWKFEHKIHLEKDKREPRFVVFNKTLFLYFFEAGTNAFRFEPLRLLMTKTHGSGIWTEPYTDIGLPHYVPWRLKVFNDKIYLSAYNGKGIYGNAQKGELRLFTSEDGQNFKAISEVPQCDWLGAEEAAFTFDVDSNLWANVRLEGEGSLLCYADKEDVSKWHFTHSKYKFDSAIMFNYKDKIYMISRRNLDGTAAKSKSRFYNLIRYSITKKRTAFFELNQQEFSWKHIMDFPSTGDNAFAAVTSISDNEIVVLNYSSSINGKEKNWIRGQLGKTFIYGTILNLDDMTRRSLSSQNWNGLKN